MIDSFLRSLEWLVWSFGVPVGGDTIPILVIALIGAGIYLTFRLGFLQLRRLGHGVRVAAGRYDDPSQPGDVSHFQALSTALSATVGIGNIAGVAIAIHWGGPGALFWMWVTAFFGMALKFAEVTLAQHYREVDTFDPKRPYAGTVAGGPMYYIDQGLGPRWKPVAIFVALALTSVSLLGSNAVQANTVADNFHAEFGWPAWMSGLATSLMVSAVIIGGIRRIGRVTAILAPLMAAIYVLGATAILVQHLDAILPSLALVVREAFQPTAGIAGTGAGAFVATMMWGVRRGLYSNEAGQGSAPIAHAAARTSEPVSEGSVALLEPLIDTLIICTMTGLVILVTGVWDARLPTQLDLRGGDATWVVFDEAGRLQRVDEPERVEVRDGKIVDGPQFAWHEAPVEVLYVDSEMTTPFDGMIENGRANTVAGRWTYETLYGEAAESGAPLTRLAFERGLGPIGAWIVLVSVFFFAVSTAISWSYYGDRCIKYLFGSRVIGPYKVVFVIFHFTGAVLPLATVWRVGDIAQGLATFPNLIAVVMLSGVVVRLTKEYFARVG